jgi:Xaa-Pro dipeptidase
MDWLVRIKEVQNLLVGEQIGGWLLYDFHGVNTLAREFLAIDFGQLTTRRFFYWIPAQGDPVKIVHAIEPHVLSHLPGRTESYLRWQELELQLGKVLQGAKTVAMEYSPKNALPYVSKVDAGTVELVRSFHVDVVSSAPLLQHYTCVLDAAQRALHLEAADFASKVMDLAWKKIAEALCGGVRVDEYQIRGFIADQMAAHGFVAEGLPICAVNAHSADPHFEPSKEGSSEIKKGDFIQIDLWCKKNHPRAVYADIARVAVADVAATELQKEIFSIVRMAQKRGTEFIASQYAKGESIKGYEVDQVCRKVIEDKGYGSYFIHRTGHNIYTEVHGPGAHIDSLETQDIRELIPHTCYSVEPGIYLPGQFGVRLEHDIYLGDGGVVQVTGGIQEEILCLLK